MRGGRRRRSAQACSEGLTQARLPGLPGQSCLASPARPDVQYSTPCRSLHRPLATAFSDGPLLLIYSTGADVIICFPHLLAFLCGVPRYQLRA